MSAAAGPLGPEIQPAPLPPPAPSFGDDESRWQAVQARDALADGRFVYCVRTTRIYCRPTCKARLARRPNVLFHATPGDARRAGFRSCKRCRPELEGSMPAEDAVRKIRAFVDGRFRPFTGADDGAAAWQSLGQMARQTGLSKWHFHRVFKKCVGVTPVEYLRIQRAATQPGCDMQHLQDADAGIDLGHLDLQLGGQGSDASLETHDADACFSFEDFLIWHEDDYQPRL